MATIVSVEPSAWTRTPVRIGRTSSRDAARATRSIVSASGAAGSFAALALSLGQAREVLGRERAEVKAGAAGGDLHVALLGAEGQRRLALGQAAHDVHEEPAGQEHRAVALDLNVVQGLGDAQLHVGGANRHGAAGRLEVDAAERREGAAARDGAPGKLERVEQGFT